MKHHAEWAGEPPVALFATRLEGRAAAAGGMHERAAGFLRGAADGFAELEAVWEAAVTKLDLARVLVSAGNGEDAEPLAHGAAQVFQRLGSVRELGFARDLLGQPA
jgi:hypothetical protein